MTASLFPLLRRGDPARGFLEWAILLAIVEPQGNHPFPSLYLEGC